jgi:menaquinone-specific isochorismate synthase
VTHDRTWRARTVEVADPGPLLDRLAADGAAWVRRGQGFVTSGTAVRRTGLSIAEARDWWAGFVDGLRYESDLGDAWGTGPLALACFPFDPGNTACESVVVVPRLILGRRGDTAWLTELSADDARAHDGVHEGPVLPTPPVVGPIAAPEVVATAPYGLAPDDWAGAVDEARRRVAAGAVSKVVLARGETVTTAAPVDLRGIVRTLADTYDNTWTYLFDGLVGASPEMLVRRQGGLAMSRVLAGTIPRNGDEQADLRLASALARSGKNLGEHEWAVASVAEALAPLCSGMNVPDAPYVLQLPNVFHLASDVTGVCRPGVWALDLVARLHPTAAVCGTPTAAARDLITEIESLDRGHYSGPVGWIDTRGDGEWAIALRCGELDAADPSRLHLFAGAGIVAESDPCEELAETRHKLAPMHSALMM